MWRLATWSRKEFKRSVELLEWLPGRLTTESPEVQPSLCSFPTLGRLQRLCCQACWAAGDRATGSQARSRLTICSEPSLYHKTLEMAPSSSHFGLNICGMFEKIALKYGMMGISAFTI